MPSRCASRRRTRASCSAIWSSSAGSAPAVPLGAAAATATGGDACGAPGTAPCAAALLARPRRPCGQPAASPDSAPAGAAATLSADEWARATGPGDDATSPIPRRSVAGGEAVRPPAVQPTGQCPPSAVLAPAPQGLTSCSAGAPFGAGSMLRCAGDGRVPERWPRRPSTVSRRCATGVGATAGALASAGRRTRLSAPPDAKGGKPGSADVSVASCSGDAPGKGMRTAEIHAEGTCACAARSFHTAAACAAVSIAAVPALVVPGVASAASGTDADRKATAAARPPLAAAGNASASVPGSTSAWARGAVGEPPPTTVAGSTAIAKADLAPFSRPAADRYPSPLGVPPVAPAWGRCSPGRRVPAGTLPD